MTKIREKTLEMIENLPDEKIIYIFNILQNIEAFSTEEDAQKFPIRDDAFDTLMKYHKNLPEDFNYKEEMEAARKEKYGSFN